MLYHTQGFKNENTLRHSSLFLLTACPCSKMIFCFAVMFFFVNNIRYDVVMQFQALQLEATTGSKFSLNNSLI